MEHIELHDYEEHVQYGDLFRQWFVSVEHVKGHRQTRHVPQRYCYESIPQAQGCMINTKEGRLQDKVITPKITHHLNTKSPHEVNSFPKTTYDKLLHLLSSNNTISSLFIIFIFFTVPNSFHFPPNRALINKLVAFHSPTPHLPPHTHNEITCILWIVQ